MSDPAPEIVGPSGLSPSSLDLWLQCPSKFFKEKVERRESPAGIDAVIGTSVHLVLEKLFALPMRQRTPTAAKLFFSEAITEVGEVEDYKALDLSKHEDVLAFRRRVWASVRTYFETENPTHIDVVATEQKLAAVIKGVPIRGIVDRIDRDSFDDLVITDYKSGKVPAPMFRAPKLRQLNLYAALVDEVLDEQPTDGRLVFTSHAQVIHTSFTPDSVAEAVETATSAWAGIQAALRDNVWPTEPGPLCGWCPFADECPEGVAFLVDRLRVKKLKTAAPNYELVADAMATEDALTD